MDSGGDCGVFVCGVFARHLCGFVAGGKFGDVVDKGKKGKLDDKLLWITKINYLVNMKLRNFGWFQYEK